MVCHGCFGARAEVMTCECAACLQGLLHQDRFPIGPRRIYLRKHIKECDG